MCLENYLNTDEAGHHRDQTWGIDKFFMNLSNECLIYPCLVIYRTRFEALCNAMWKKKQKTSNNTSRSGSVKPLSVNLSIPQS